MDVPSGKALSADCPGKTRDSIDLSEYVAGGLTPSDALQADAVLWEMSEDSSIDDVYLGLLARQLIDGMGDGS
jgi:hypothetical protein